jgi:hypothetical protein
LIPSVSPNQKRLERTAILWENPTMKKTIEVKLDEKCRVRLAKFGRPGERYLAESPRPGEIHLRKLVVQQSKPIRARIVRIDGRKYLTHQGQVSDDDTQKIMAEFP